MEKRLKINQLSPGMIVAKNVSGKSGYPIVTKGSKLTQAHIQKCKENKIIDIYIQHNVSAKTNQISEQQDDLTMSTRTDITLNHEQPKSDGLQYMLDEIIRNELKQLAHDSLHRHFFLIELAHRKDTEIKQLIDRILIDPHVLALITVCKSHDPKMISIHSQILVLAILIGLDLGLDEDQLVSLGKSALIYRIGDLISFNKTEGHAQESTQSELADQAKSGHELLKKWFEPDVCRVALEQHERFDGSGFPNYKSGNELSLMSKIIAVSSKFIYLQVNRNGKKSPTMELAMDYVMNGEGVWYDPNVVNSFKRFVAPFRLGAVVELRDGSRAIIVRNGTPPDYAPLIKIMQSKHTTFVEGEFIDTSRHQELIVRRVLSESIH